VGRHTDRFLEGPAEVGRRHPNHPCERLHIQSGVQVSVDVLSDTPERLARPIALSTAV
jgi:hypothetical protein